MKKPIKAVLVAASPSPESRSTWVLHQVGNRLHGLGVAIDYVSLADFDAADLLWARTTRTSIQRFLDKVREASALIVSTPVYKATYSGGLKAIIDIIDPTELAGKVLLGIATTRFEDHAVTVSEGFTRLGEFFSGSLSLATIVVQDYQLGVPGAFVIPSAANIAIDEAVAIIAGHALEPQQVTIKRRQQESTQ